MDGHSRNQYATKRKRKSHLTWRKRQRKVNEPLVKRIEEQVVKVEAEIDKESDNCINVLSTSSDSINTDSSEFNKSFNLTICHEGNTTPVENMASNDGRPSRNDNSYLESCQNLLGNHPIINLLLIKMNEEQLLPHFMAFVNGITEGSISVSNIAILLALEYSYLMSLSNTTRMRYRYETCKFWEIVQTVGGSRLMRLFSSDKHHGKVNSNVCLKSKYHPETGNFNFAVPDKKILSRSKTEIPNRVPAGIISESLTMIDKSKEIVVCLDGKQTAKGLRNSYEGDVDLWGFEGPPSLKDSHEENQREITFFDMLALKLTDTENFCAEAIKEVKFALQISSHKIKNLREAVVRHEILRNTFQNKIKKTPNIGSKYMYAFSEIDAFIERSKSLISKLLNLNLKWCKVMATINRNEGNFNRNRTITLDEQNNGYILLEPELLEILYGDKILDENPHIVKQRTPQWLALRARSKITSSTMHDALGFRTLKKQKEHYDRYVSKTNKNPVEVNPAMEHGTQHEVCGKYCIILNR